MGRHLQLKEDILEVLRTVAFREKQVGNRRPRAENGTLELLLRIFRWMERALTRRLQTFQVPGCAMIRQQLIN